MTNAPNRLSVARVKQVLDYDPETGLFYRKIKTSNRAPAGPTSGSMNALGYLSIAIDGQKNYAHRLAWVISHGEWPSEMIDHVNGIRHDNRLSNLRLAKNRENQGNRGAQTNNTCGLKGVSRKGSAFEARIIVEGKKVHLGLRNTAEEAHALYIEASKKYFGEFHRS